MSQRFLSYGSRLSETWCPFVYDSKNINDEFLKIKEMVEATEEYQIDVASERYGYYFYKVKVYLDSSVTAGGKRLLGSSNDGVFDVNGIMQRKTFSH